MMINMPDETLPKILIVTSYWKGSNGGGIMTFLINLVDELVRRGAKVDVVFKDGEDEKNYKINDADDSSIYPLKVMHAFIQLRRIRPNAIHFHGQLFYYLLAAYIYKIVYGANLIYTFHTEPAPGDRISAIRTALLQMLFNKCDHITFVSQALRVKVADIWGFEFRNSAITYAGVRSEEVSNDEIEKFREKYNISSRHPVLLALGMTALSYKAEGLKILIRAFGKIKDKYPNSVLIATRDGSYIKELRELAENECLGDSVIFTGNLRSPFVALGASDVYTHISLGEGLPVSLLEAMSMGKPIIATPAGGIPEAIEDGINGIIVRPDEDDLVRRLEFLLNNPEFSKTIGDNARKTASDKFTWQRSADAFLRLYLS